MSADLGAATICIKQPMDLPEFLSKNNCNLIYLSKPMIACHLLVDMLNLYVSTYLGLADSDIALPIQLCTIFIPF